MTLAALTRFSVRHDAVSATAALCTFELLIFILYICGVELHICVRCAVNYGAVLVSEPVAISCVLAGITPQSGVIKRRV